MYVIGVAPVHVPLLVASVEPWAAEPPTVGTAVKRGAPLDPTWFVAFEAASVVPLPFVARTCTRRRKPLSADWTVYDVFVAPLITPQLEPSPAPPSALQRTHW